MKSSGCGPVVKGDLMYGAYMIQHKYVNKFKLTNKLIEHVIADADTRYRNHKIPAIMVTFKDNSDMIIVPVKKKRRGDTLVELSKSIELVADNLNLVFCVENFRYNYWKTMSLVEFLEFDEK